MEELKIEPMYDARGALSGINVRISCACGRIHHLSASDGDHHSFCPVCQQALYIKNHEQHFHIAHKDMSRDEMIQESYGRVQVPIRV